MKVAAFSIAAIAIPLAAPAIPEQQPPQKVIISKKINSPAKKRTFRWKFTPPAHPSPAGVKKIIAREHALWGGPSIYNRVSCETGGIFNWNALNPNGIYKGVLQFGPIWWSMWPGTPRKVRIIITRKKRLKEVHTLIFSDGSKTKQVTKRFWGIRKYIRTGYLPKNANQYHAYAAIRVGQRAVSGHGPTTGWECGL